MLIVLIYWFLGLRSSKLMQKKASLLSDFVKTAREVHLKALPFFMCRTCSFDSMPKVANWNKPLHVLFYTFMKHIQTNNRRIRLRANSILIIIKILLTQQDDADQSMPHVVMHCDHPFRIVSLNYWANFISKTKRVFSTSYRLRNFELTKYGNNIVLQYRGEIVRMHFQFDAKELLITNLWLYILF